MEQKIDILGCLHKSVCNWVIMLESDSEDSHQNDTTSRVSHDTAVKSFDECLQWLQQQKEASLYNVGVLCELQGLAARKRVQCSKQKNVNRIFSTS